ncbi:homoserine kinase [Fulvivirga sedimenti]|uniref:Homoserine kinase n=1 Tax=Fulvivirga sedimenti TaxID=2879465 RepID=A0A9X1HTV8_9BACT|nr:homoserine kinase [Fulvivirga sedimenti]MCA6078223.1 homoserine kinase [Fulvivirga sedimenti]
MSEHITIFAPATIANVGPGFDVFGLALNDIGDTIEMSLKDEKGITIINGTGCEGLPTNPETNVAGVALKAMLQDLGTDQGITIQIHKNITPGSGLGSSASSAAGAVFGLNCLLGSPYSKNELVQFAMEGEGAVSFSPHADNVAPSLLGGFTVVRSYDPLDVISIPVNMQLWFTVVHPQIEVKTSDSKRMLKREISLKQGIRQWGNVAGVIAALMGGDYDLLGRSMHDPLIEPIRSMLIPGFDEAKQSALKAGALACSISGSGPSIFAITASERDARSVSESFSKIYKRYNIDHHIYISGLNSEGTSIVE